MGEVIVFFAVTIVVATILVQYWKIVLIFFLASCFALIFMGVLSLLAGLSAIHAQHG